MQQARGGRRGPVSGQSGFARLILLRAAGAVLLALGLSHCQSEQDTDPRAEAGAQQDSDDAAGPSEAGTEPLLDGGWPGDSADGAEDQSRDPGDAEDADAGDADAGDADAGDADAGDAEDAGDADAGDAGDDAGEDGVADACGPAASGNPFVDGWYADPDMKIYEDKYWVYPTYSAPYEQQTFLDAFSSPDMVHWTKHARILDTAGVSWATRAIWAPSPIFRDGTYYLYFGANDIQNDTQEGGIGVAKASRPEGPYVDAIGAPLIDHFENGAQPIDQNVFIDDDGQAYMYYGGHGHCNVVKLNDDMISLGTLDDGSKFKEITPSGFVEGALMFKRNGTYYFMWSEGGWTGPDYRVSYAMANSPLGPFNKLGTVLSQNASVATGSGHNTVVNVPGSDTWYIVYHRRPLGVNDGNHRVLSYDLLSFNADGTIRPVDMVTRDGFCDGNALGWSDKGGAWSVTAEHYSVAPAPGAKSLLNNKFSALTYTAQVSVGARGDAGLLFRVSQAAQSAHGYRGYYAGIDAEHGRVFLGKSDGASFSELAGTSRSVAPDTSHQLRVEANGTKLTVYFDGDTEPTLTASDADHVSGATGLMAHDSSASFDDVDVSAPESAVFYEHGNYDGLAVALGAGEYGPAELRAAGIADNSVSSLRVPDGWRVEAYDGNDFDGSMWTFSADTPAVPGDANDAMSSVRVLAP